MKLRNFLSTLFILTTLITFSRTSVIKGISKPFKGKEITVYSYSDYITKSKIKRGYTTIKPDGSFEFTFETEHIEKITLKIEDKTTRLYVEPGGIYNISLTYNETLNKGKIYDKILSLKFNFPVPNELNQKIHQFNRKVDQFIDDNYNQFIKRDRSIEPKIKAFKQKSLNELEETTPEFLKNYIIYTFGTMENTLDVSYNKRTVGKNSFNTKANIFMEYLGKKPILYHNPEYINLFQEFFKGEIKNLSLTIKGMDISEAINEHGTYQALSKALSKYPFLQNDEFKGLFILHGLLDLAGSDKYFKKNNIISILKKIQTTSKYPEQQQIAQNIIQVITKEKLKIGQPAPNFTLTNKNNKPVSLNSFKGKHLYINFWSTWNTPSLKEMKIMEVIYKKYKGKVEFLSICTDNNLSKMNTFIENNPNYKWSFLHIGKNKTILEDYNVLTLPVYILIDNKSNIVQAPAARPGGTAERATEENIERIFYEINNH